MFLRFNVTMRRVLSPFFGRNRKDEAQRDASPRWFIPCFMLHFCSFLTVLISSVRSSSQKNPLGRRDFRSELTEGENVAESQECAGKCPNPGKSPMVEEREGPVIPLFSVRNSENNGQKV